MTIGPGGEAMPEEVAEVFRADADAVVRDRNLQAAVLAPADTHGQHPFRRGRFAQGPLRVADQVAKNLQDPVFVQGHFRNRRELADHPDLQRLQPRGLHPQGVLDECGHGLHLGDSSDPGVVLLPGHNHLDVVNVVRERVHFREQAGLFGGNLFRQAL